MEDRDDNTEKPIAEQDGVRLVGRDEAEAAIRAGEAVGRRPASQSSIILSQSSDGLVPRFPSSTQTDLSGTQSRPTMVTRSAPIVIEEGEDEERALDLRPSGVKTGLPVRLRGSVGDARDNILAERNQDDVPEDTDQSVRRSSDDDSLPEAGALPHWTEPATGEVPIAFLDADAEGQAAGAFPRWRDPNRRDNVEPMSFDDLGEASGLGANDISADPSVVDAVDRGEIDGVLAAEGAASPSQPAEGDDGDDSSTVSSTAETVAPKGGARFRTPSAAESAKSKLSTLSPVSLGPRVATAVIFAVAALGAFAMGPAWSLTLATAVILLAAVELFDGFRRVGYRPATVLALLGVAGTMLGSYARGPEAMALMLVLMLVFTFLWYMTGVIKEAATSNAAVTILGFVWTGVLGSYAALMLRLPAHRGMALLIGAVLLTIVYDTTAYLGGSVFGKHALSPSISPNKTWEGLVAGTIGAVVAGAFLVSLIHPWNFSRAILLGVVVSIVAPLGDLAESMVKRDLGLKDMGRLLPGHGGAMDRFDALLFVLPATYYLARILNLA